MTQNTEDNEKKFADLAKAVFVMHARTEAVPNCASSSQIEEGSHGQRVSPVCPDLTANTTSTLDAQRQHSLTTSASVQHYRDYMMPKIIRGSISKSKKLWRTDKVFNHETRRMSLKH